MQRFLSDRKGQQWVHVSVIILVSLFLGSHSDNNWLYQQRREKHEYYCKPWIKLGIEIWIESNLKVIFKCWLKLFVQSSKTIQSFFQSLMILFLSCYYMQTLKLSFVRRQVNSVVHTLARASNSWTNFLKFVIIRLCIEFLIINEMH
jgi:hypothetical protein